MEEIKLKIYNEDGLVKEDRINLFSKCQEREITQFSPNTSYVANNLNDCSADSSQGVNNQFNAVSGGQIFPSQQINKINKSDGKSQILNEPISANIKIRYDKNDPLESRWNVDVYVDIHNPDLNWQDKRLITKRPKKAHKIKDSSWIRVDWEIDEIKQESIKSVKP